MLSLQNFIQITGSMESLTNAKRQEGDPRAHHQFLFYCVSSNETLTRKVVLFLKIKNIVEILLVKKTFYRMYFSWKFFRCNFDRGIIINILKNREETI